MLSLGRRVRSHRGRLTWVAAVSAGLLLAIVFGGIVVETRAEEMKEAKEVLRLTLAQAIDEVRSNPQSPDLDEITRSEPRVTLDAFRPDGDVVARSGTLPLTARSSDGKTFVGDAEVVVATAKESGTVLVAAVPWTGREAAIHQLAFLLATLWLPLTACAAFATWFASRETFRPLDELASQAEAMATGDVGARLSLPGDDEYALFTTRLNHFLALIEDSMQRQERFVQDAAHELRTPLTILRTRLELTAMRERSGDEYRVALSGALKETERLILLAEGLLRLGDAGVKLAGPIRLGRLVDFASERWHSRFADQDVRLEIASDESSALITEVEFSVLLDNLFSNALRASPSGSRCMVSVLAAPSGKGVKVSVEDEGPGVDETQREVIFERFTRGDEARNRDSGGFGIGLALCRRIVTSRGGRIWVEEAHSGARFVVELPSPTNVSGIIPNTPSTLG